MQRYQGKVVRFVRWLFGEFGCLVMCCEVGGVNCKVSGVKNEVSKDRL